MRKWAELSQDERHAVLLEALEAPEGERNEVARRHDVQREHMYVILRRVKEDPERQLELARKEADFRLRVIQALRRQRVL